MYLINGPSIRIKPTIPTIGPVDYLVQGNSEEDYLVRDNSDYLVIPKT
jgi:hypothetical protein